MGKRILSFIIYFVLLASLLSLSACGRQEHQRGIDGCIYEAELLSGTEEWGKNFKSSGNWLYYIGNDSDLYRILLEGDGKPEGEGTGFQKKVLDYTVDAEGCVYCYRAGINWLESGNVELAEGTLSKYREDGSEAYCLALDGRKAVYGGLYSVPGFLACGSEGQVFLLCGDSVLVVDESGNMISEVDISIHRPDSGYYGVEKLLEGEEGRVCYLSEDNGKRSLYEFADGTDRPQAISLKGLEGKDFSLGSFYGSQYGVLYSGSDGVLYRFQAQDGIWQAIMRWNDSDLPGDAQELAWVSESRLLAVFLRSDGDEYYFLGRKQVKDLPEKEELVLACADYYSSDLEDAVLRFNRENAACRINLQIYEGEEGIIRLDTELASSNPPDMLDLSNLDVAKYMEKQVLENLDSYLSESSVLKREDFLEGVLEGYTVGGRLAGIPDEFMCFVLLGRTAEVGSRAGWTVEDMVALTEAYPGRKLNGNSFYGNLDSIFGDYIMERFIDRDGGTCDFDSEEFRNFVKWLSEHCGSGAGYYDREEVEDPLVSQQSVFTFLDYLRHEARAEGTTMTGFPSADGKPLYRASSLNAVGIVSKSRYREEAWQFIEFFLSRKWEDFWDSPVYMPCRRDLLEGILEDAATPEYWIVDGEVELDQDGNPEEKWKWRFSYQNLDGDVVECIYDCADQEEIEGFLDMIGHTDFSSDNRLQSEVTGIIAEEMGSYFSGDKALEEVTKVIQNRVSTLIQE